MLRVLELRKSYPQRGIVLNGLSLELKESETIAVTGPSGSGKTTLLNLVGLLDRPDSGEILFREKLVNNYTVDEAADYRNRQIGFIFQDHLLLPYLTVMENILLPLSARQLEDDEYRVKVGYARELMERTGIMNLSSKYPWQVSGGEAQRAALVRALINKPSLLLADEPTGSLDAANAEILGNLLKEISSQYGTAVILATHSMTLAKKMSIIYKIENGKLVKI
ncbi:MAG TPA: ABC transporter ATP-binding protein [Bacteroidales bacterium]|nr:ABC transporter ATP-binding protein [Bacteroidales bacterium]HOK73873.1 ABC transporter ATP-binding protein [Bacteroidales bacterium]HOM39605.1 ABC transporter ATP-binding protein [Bacteroidales bacterium]HOU30316.1 ABC transporter ATP-binding protein [Bacteroidales bacterium]HPP91647.1 ABC transporter ATP-binding protein [Bacteroidales bacterium]